MPWLMDLTPYPGPSEYDKEPECNGICIMASDLIAGTSGVAYAHPECELHY